MQKKSFLFFVSLLFVLMTATVSAATVWDEAVDGPLSADGLNPTDITLADGTNAIIASVGSFPDVRYFSVVVPANHKLTAINLTTHSGGDPISWFAAMTGSQFTENSLNSTEINVNNLLGHSHIGSNLGVMPYNVLPDMSIEDGLNSGTYSFRMQNWGTGINFSFDFVLEETSVTAINLATFQTNQPTSTHAIWWMVLFLLIATVFFGRKSGLLPQSPR